MNRSCVTTLGIFIALAALIVAMLAWLTPFSPIGPSPLAPKDTEEPSIVATSLATAAVQSSEFTNTIITRTIRLPSGHEVVQVFVPSGSFLMGSEDGEDIERQVFRITLTSFWINQTEVTNAQFQAFVSYTGYQTTAERKGRAWTWTGNDFDYVDGAYWRHPQGPNSNIVGLENHPVVHVSWEDASAFCAWSGHDNNSAALPTEAQWEYAARGPNSLTYPWGNKFDCRFANIDDEIIIDSITVQGEAVCDGYDQAAPVGSFPRGASWVGALDMTGNVWEWVNDWYDSDYYGALPAPVEDPQGPSEGTTKVIRGGGWSPYPRIVRPTQRSYATPDSYNLDTGFRCAQK